MNLNEFPYKRQMSRLMRKPTICIGETKTHISFAVTAKLISAFVFATRMVQFLFYLNPKFEASSSLLCFYWPVCVGSVRKPHCWFSNEAAQINRPHFRCLSYNIRLIVASPFQCILHQENMSVKCIPH